MKELTLLSKEQIIGENKLEYFKKNEAFTQATDFAILLGCEVNEKRLGLWWTKTFKSYAFHDIISNDKDKYCLGNSMALARNIGLRPALYIEKQNSDEIKYGEYPQWIVPEETKNKLEQLYKLNILLKTGKEYTIDKIKINGSIEKFKEEKISEYELNHKKYIRIIGSQEWKNKTLSNGEKIKDGEPYWISIEPIKWIVEKNIMFSKYILFAGIPFNAIKENDILFETSEIKKYLDTYFLSEIEPSKNIKSVDSKNEYLDNLIKSKQRLKKIQEKTKLLKELSKEKEKKEKEISQINSKINNIFDEINNEIQKLEFKDEQIIKK